MILRCYNTIATKCELSGVQVAIGLDTERNNCDKSDKYMGDSMFLKYVTKLIL